LFRSAGDEHEARAADEMGLTADDEDVDSASWTAGPPSLTMSRKAGVMVSVMAVPSWLVQLMDRAGLYDPGSVALTGIEPVTSRVSPCNGPVAWVCPTRG
jgi:hypothetical protein